MSKVIDKIDEKIQEFTKGGKPVCYHCSDICPDDSIEKDGKYFCCNGCLFVFELINKKDLGKYYEIADKAGITPKDFDPGEYEFLEDSSVSEKLLKYTIGNRSKIIFYLPQVYCSACIWLLENLFKIDEAIFESRVDFLKKEISIEYNNEKTSLRKIAELLTRIGYRPELNLGDIDSKPKTGIDKSLYLKLGVAGFSFGNIMLFALPEYLSGGNVSGDIKTFLNYLALLFIPPGIYAGSGYIKSAWQSLKIKHINIDVPISIGIFVLAGRSIYEILTGAGSGYVDSLTGLVFFLLIGRVFQQKTFHNITFSRNYKSYFPLTVQKVESELKKYIPVEKIEPGDMLSIRNNEVIVVDSILESEDAEIDYSFVTGESKPVAVSKGDGIFSGAKLIGKRAIVRAKSNFDSSYLTELWNSGSFSNYKQSFVSKLSDKAAKYFTIVVLLLSIITFIYWAGKDINTAMNAVTAVLIIACPCAIALSIPFTYGTAMRIFARAGFFIKDDKIIELLSKITSVIFDKTGTLTSSGKGQIIYEGEELSEIEESLVKSAAVNSTHPHSVSISGLFEKEIHTPDHYTEVPGLGIHAKINGYDVKLGKYSWVSPGTTKDVEPKESSVALSINDKYKGVFKLKSGFRYGIDKTVNRISVKYKTSILSGDSESDADEIIKRFSNVLETKFRQLPNQKLDFIHQKQADGEFILMVGDGLNDAGALNNSDVGIAVTDNTSGFTPGSDAIIDSKSLHNLPEFLEISKKSIFIVLTSYFISLLYHILGFWFATQGLLSPVIAAILMPLSSISVVLFTVLSIRLISLKLKMKID